MKISRNAPCPCGSGRKYKDCCLRLDRERAPSAVRPSRDALRASRETLAAARSEDHWEADVLPMPWSLDDDPVARPSLLAVMAGPLVVCSDVLRRPSGEASEVSTVLLGAVEEAAGLVGRWPRELAVRHPEVAVHLDLPLRERGCFIRVEPHLRNLDGMAVDMAYAEGTTERVSRLVMSRPDTWSAWGIESAAVGRIFAAARDLWMAEPWNAFMPFDVIEAELPDGSSWYVSILGVAVPPVGLVVYSDFTDCKMSASADSLTAVVDRVEGWFYTLLFEDAPGLPRAMRREVARQSWPVAAPSAYPRLMAVNTPAGGLSREDATMLATVMAGLASLIPQYRDDILDDRWRSWADPAGRVRFTLAYPPDGDIDEEDDGWFADGSNWAGDDVEDQDGETVGDSVLSSSSLLQVLDDVGREELSELMARTLSPDLEEVQAVLRRASDRYNGTPQEELGGLSPDQVQRLLTADWSDPHGPLFVDRSLSAEEASRARMLRNAWGFLDALVEEGGTRATVAGNLNRAFVARMREALESPHAERDALLDSYRQVVNEEDIGYLHLLRVVLEIGGLVKRRKGLWTATHEGRRLRDREKAGALFALLVETMFRTLDLRSMDAVGAGEGFQYQVPFALRRFRDVGQVWATPAELAGPLLLPVVRQSIPPSEYVDSAAILVETRFLAPLENLGLAERQEVPGPSRAFPGRRYRTSPLYGRVLRLRT